MSPKKICKKIPRIRPQIFLLDTQNFGFLCIFINKFYCPRDQHIAQNLDLSDEIAHLATLLLVLAGRRDEREGHIYEGY